MYGLDREHALEPMQAEVEHQFGVLDYRSVDADLIIDFSDDSPPPSSHRLLTPLFNGRAGELGLMMALTGSEPILVELIDSCRPGSAWWERPASVDREVLGKSMDGILSATARLLLSAVERGGAPHPSVKCVSQAVSPQLPTGGAVTASWSFAARSFIHKVTRRLTDLALGDRKWMVAWRPGGCAQLLNRARLGYSIVPDDRRRYFADPFPFSHNGREFIFVEEFPYATGRGCISVLEVKPGGQTTSLGIVLEEPFHLSYPFVFELGGDIWMIPEAGEGRGVYLYRATQFPFKWERSACLISGINAYDATLLRHDDRYWLFLCERAWHSSGWDMLSLYHARDLFGDWTRHICNPVIIDATLCRPGGAMFIYNGTLVRPAQNCSGLYGGSIELCRIDNLSEDTFSQTVVGHINAGAFGCHTYNASAGLEVIDVFGRPPGRGQIEASFIPISADVLRPYRSADANVQPPPSKAMDLPTTPAL
ncbi:MAG: hypothetical protein JO001_22435 [Alphaproteobacteria bacterium]|nr:hypothetical protein [Alphaproteobacteria bacterium]